MSLQKLKNRNDKVRKKVFMVEVRAMLLELHKKTWASIHFDRETDDFNEHISHCIKVTEAEILSKE